VKKPILAFVVIVVALFVLTWGGYALTVAMSGPKGVGDAIKTKNSSANWTAAQAKFEELHQGVKAADQKTELAGERLKLNPTDLTLQQQHAGIQSGCISIVADYNAESRKFLSEDFKSTDLPYQIDQTNPATDCK